jgi:hypothetical protein
MADQGASTNPKKTEEQKELQQQIREQARRMAQGNGFDWESMSKAERAEMKRSARALIAAAAERAEASRKR